MKVFERRDIPLLKENQGVYPYPYPLSGVYNKKALNSSGYKLKRIYFEWADALWGVQEYGNCLTRATIMQNFFASSKNIS